MTLTVFAMTMMVSAMTFVGLVPRASFVGLVPLVSFGPVLLVSLIVAALSAVVDWVAVVVPHGLPAR